MTLAFYERLNMILTNSERLAKIKPLADQETWRKNIRDLSVSAADGAIVALTEELEILGKELPKEKIQSLELEIRKLVRQTVFSELCPKTHMD